MQGVLLSDPLSDGTYHISFESDKVWVGERKNTINDAVVYDYDRYTAPEIEALSEGDTIVTHLNGTEETTALTVESIERENNYVTINGGIEEGGIDLCKEEDHYRTLTWDDFPAYYEVGVVKQLVMADDIELSDGAADFGADPVMVKGDRAVCDAMSSGRSRFVPPRSFRRNKSDAAQRYRAESGRGQAVLSFAIWVVPRSSFTQPRPFWDGAVFVFAPARPSAITS